MRTKSCFAFVVSALPSSFVVRSFGGLKQGEFRLFQISTSNFTTYLLILLQIKIIGIWKNKLYWKELIHWSFTV